ncbi:MAG: polysaccharide lyase family 8 super-sandwich domain-containing protein, partial [Acutalibacteraceae bacterium]
YDWRHVPGVTAPAFLSRQYGADKDRDFCFGLSDGRIGSTGYVFTKYDGQGTTSGTTAVFLLDNGYVALGAGIESDSPAPVHTTLNQTLAADPQIGGQPLANTRDTLAGGAWAHNNRIGYVLLQSGALHAEYALHQPEDYPSLWKTGYTQFSIDCDGRRPEDHPVDPTFSLWLDHGVNPQGGTYAFAVLPGATPEQTAAFAENPAVTVLQNTTALQAIACADGAMMANFYQPGELSWNGHTLSVDRPCAVLWRPNALSAAVANDQPGVTLTVIDDGQRRVFEIPALPYTGKTITKERNQA